MPRIIPDIHRDVVKAYTTISMVHREVEEIQQTLKSREENDNANGIVSHSGILRLHRILKVTVIQAENRSANPDSSQGFLFLRLHLV